MATDRGAAILDGGQWTVLEQGDTRAVAVGRDGAIWVVAAGSAPDAGTEVTVASFRFDGRAWVRRASVRTGHASLTTFAGTFEIVLGPDNQPWVGSRDYFG